MSGGAHAGGTAWEHASRGATLQAKGDLGGAISAYRLALSAEPGLWQVCCNLGAALRAAGDLEGAREVLTGGLALAPEAAEVHLNLGLVLHESGDLDDAEQHLRAAVGLRPALAESHFNLGNLLGDRLRYSDAIAAYRRAIEIRPDYADAHWNLAQNLLFHGDWNNGFEEYEWRWRLQKLQRYARAFRQPQWRGEDVEGKTVLLWWEQGFGDTIQFLRYAPMVAARGARVAVEVQPTLAALAATVPGVIQAASFGETLPPFDVHCPVMSLARIFQTHPGGIPGSTPYMNASPEHVEKWRKRLGKPRKLRVGLVWSSGIRDERTLFLSDVSKSMPLAFLAPLGRVACVELHSLQVGKPAAEARARPHGLRVRDWQSELRDFSETAGLIANLDLVITVDTAVGHLAGAMAKPVWVLMKPAHCWRWIGNGADTPWYPTMRIFRQHEAGDWSAPVAAVAKELAQLAAAVPRTGILAALARGLLPSRP